MRAARAGLAYFALVLLVGTGLGTVKILLAEPRLGAVSVALIELPLMLGASWLICGWVVERLAVPADAGSRLLMGGLAFALLMAAELALALFVIGGSVADHFEAYRDAAPLLGLAGQIIFAAFPLIRASKAAKPKRRPSPSAWRGRPRIGRARPASARSPRCASRRFRSAAAAVSD